MVKVIKLVDDHDQLNMVKVIKSVYDHDQLKMVQIIKSVYDDDHLKYHKGIQIGIGGSRSTKPGKYHHKYV